MAELRTATTWNDVGLQGRIHERIERKSVKRMHRVGRGPPHAHFRRTHVSARTLLALYNQARLAYLEKAKRLASAESHCAHGEYSEDLDSTFQIGLLGQAEKADGSVGLVRSPGCYSTVG